MMKSLVSILIALSLQCASFLAFANSTATVPQVHVQTNLGTFTVELYPDKAPKTVANFLRYVNDGFYQNTVFHRLIGGYVAQAGGYDSAFAAKQVSYEPVVIEANNGLKNVRGTIAMAREGEPNSGTSQFFINLADNDALDFRTPTRRGWGYTVFGRIVAGEEVLDALNKATIKAQGAFKYMPETPIIIQSMTADSAAARLAPLPTAQSIPAAASEAATEDNTEDAATNAGATDTADSGDGTTADNTDTAVNAEVTETTTDGGEETVADSTDGDPVETGDEVNDAPQTAEPSTADADAPEKPEASAEPAVAQATVAHIAKSDSPAHATSSGALPEPPDIPAVQ